MMEHGAVGVMDKLLLYKALKDKSEAEISASGNPAVLEGTVEGRAIKDAKIFGWSKQQTTTGRNLLQVKDEPGKNIHGATWQAQDGIISVHGEPTGTTGPELDYYLYGAKGVYEEVTFPLGTITVIVRNLPEGTKFYVVKQTNSEVVVTLTGNTYAYTSFTHTTNQKYRIMLRPTADQQLDADNIKITFSTGTDLIPWEPYTGGQPSPNPDYPQEITSAGMKWSTGKNLLVYPYETGNGTQTGVTWTAQNGHINGTGETLGGLNYYFYSGTLEPGNYGLKTNGKIDGVKLMVYDATDKASLNVSNFEAKAGNRILIYLNQGYSGVAVDVDTDIILAKVEDLDTTPYEPYTGGVPKLYGDKIGTTLRGTNIFNVKLLVERQATTRGVTFTNKGGNIVNIKGTTTSKYVVIGYRMFLKSGTYYISGGTSVSTGVFRVYYGGKTYYNTKFKLESDATVNVQIQIDNENQTVDEDIYCYLTNTDITSFEAYYAPQTLSISTLTGLPGIPVSSSGNYTDANGQRWVSDYIDLARGKYVQRIACGIITHDIKVYALNRYTTHPEVTQVRAATEYAYEKAAVLCHMFRNLSITWNNNVECIGMVEYGLIDFVINNDRIGVDENSTDTERSVAVKEWLKDNPIKYHGILENPIERDLTKEEIQAYQKLVTYEGTTVLENDQDCYMKVSSTTGDTLRAKKLALLLGD